MKWRQPLECGCSELLWYSTSLLWQRLGGSPPHLLSWKSVESADDYQSGSEQPRSKGSADPISEGDLGLYRGYSLKNNASISSVLSCPRVNRSVISARRRRLKSSSLIIIRLESAV